MTKGRPSSVKKAAPRDAVSKVAQQRLSLLELARQLGNVAEACRRRKIVRTGFHDRRRRFQTQRVEGLNVLPPIHKSRPQNEPLEQPE